MQRQGEKVQQIGGIRVILVARCAAPGTAFQARVKTKAYPPCRTDLPSIENPSKSFWPLLRFSSKCKGKLSAMEQERFTELNLCWCLWRLSGPSRWAGSTSIRPWSESLA
jgi:hypothetical protein